MTSQGSCLSAQRATALKPCQTARRAEQRLLQRVLGTVQRAEHPVAVREELRLIARHKEVECRRVAASGADQKSGLVQIERA